MVSGASMRVETILGLLAALTVLLAVFLVALVIFVILLALTGTLYYGWGLIVLLVGIPLSFGAYRYIAHFD